jgi:hypothetical protein
MRAPLGAIDIGQANCLPDWIICGGESGGGARPMHPAWARHVRDQCHALGIAFLHKDTKKVENGLLFMPTNLTKGIDVSDDPILNTRTEAYGESYGRRIK